MCPHRGVEISLQRFAPLRKHNLDLLHKLYTDLSTFHNILVQYYYNWQDTTNYISIAC